MLSAIATTFAGRAISDERSYSSTSSAERRHREALVVVDDLLADLVAEDEGVRGAAVKQAERDAGVRGMEQRALALDPEQLAAAVAAFDHERLGGAGEEVGDDGVDGDPPPRDRDPGLAGRDELALDATAARLGVELERDGHLPDRAVGADGEDDLRRRA